MCCSRGFIGERGICRRVSIAELDEEEDVEDILEEEHDSIEEDEDFDLILRCFLLMFLVL